MFTLISAQGYENKDHNEIILHGIDWHKLISLTLLNATENADPVK